MKLVFFGSGAFGLPTLQSLSKNHDVLAVVTQPDRPAGRKKKLTPTPIAQWAGQHLDSAQLIKPENVNDPEVLARVRGFDADAWVVIAFGQKLSEPLLADRFAINLHASLLPRWRGAAPIHHAIIAGDSETGNSVITLAQKMDAGLVLGQSRRAIEPAQTTGELHDLLAADGPALVKSVLDEFERDALTPIEQDESLVTLAGKFQKEDGSVDWSREAREIANQINGMSPWPCVTVRFRGEPLKLLRAEQGDADISAPPGSIVDATAGLVATGEGALRIIDVQPASRKPMTWSAFVNGYEVKQGEALESG